MYQLQSCTGIVLHRLHTQYHPPFFKRGQEKESLTSSLNKIGEDANRLPLYGVPIDSIHSLSEPVNMIFGGISLMLEALEQTE